MDLLNLIKNHHLVSFQDLVSLKKNPVVFLLWLFLKIVILYRWLLLKWVVCNYLTVYIKKRQNMIIKNFFKAVNKLCCHSEKCTQKRNLKKILWMNLCWKSLLLCCTKLNWNNCNCYFSCYLLVWMCTIVIGT